MRKFSDYMATFLTLSLLLFVGACGEGSDGAAGAIGPQGPPGPQLAATALETCEVCHAEDRVADVAVVHGLADSPLANVPDVTALTVAFTGVVVGPPLVATFTLKDQNGDPVTGVSLTNSPTEPTYKDVRFMIARLFPASGGNASYWMSYIYSSSSDNPTYDGSPTLTETATPGTYTVTFSKDITAGATALNAVTVPTAVAYDAAATHRIGMQTGRHGSILPQANFTYDFVPDGSAVTVTRDIVATATCNECHGKLEVHGRVETKYCVTCHNPGNPDADMKDFIHKIHRGRDLPSVVAGGTYGWGGSHDYTFVGFPQYPLGGGAGIQNCTKCHDAANTATPDGGNWATVPTIEACGSCHDDVNFTTGAGHQAGAKTNADCLTCHSSTATDSPAAAHNKAANSAPLRYAAEVAKIQHVISSATYSAGAVTVEFYVVNPTANTAYDLNPTTGSDPFTGSGAGLTLSVAWDSSKDFTNAGTGSLPARALDTNVLSAVTAGTITADANLLYTAVITLPTAAQTAGSGIVFLQGHPVGDLDGDGTYSNTLPVPNVSRTFAITDASPKARRAIVDIAKCNSCHGTLSIHGNNRTNNIEVCAACHNPSHTDINRRPSDASTTTDKKVEESIDFKRLIHGIHGSGKRENPIVVYGFGNTEHVFGEEEVVYPGVLNDCSTCHVGDSYALPLASTVQGSTILSGSGADQGDDLNISPAAAVCSSCHDTGTALGHMELNGASFKVTEANITTF